MKRESNASLRNRGPILEVLRDVLADGGVVFELGSGFGAHAAFFTAHLDRVYWQPSDYDEADLISAAAWAAESDGRVRTPLRVDAFDDPARQAVEPAAYDVVVAINVVHITPPEMVERLFVYGAHALRAGGEVLVYGPWRDDDRPLEPSNAQFEVWLKDRDPRNGIRRIQAADATAARFGFARIDDRPMPSNNRLIRWRLTR
jgi:cyclopropane fatty-acyl-phospholipid synthase-like methyltransferase